MNANLNEMTYKKIFPYLGGEELYRVASAHASLTLACLMREWKWIGNVIDSSFPCSQKN